MKQMVDLRLLLKPNSSLSYLICQCHSQVRPSIALLLPRLRNSIAGKQQPVEVGGREHCAALVDAHSERELQMVPGTRHGHIDIEKFRGPALERWSVDLGSLCHFTKAFGVGRVGKTSYTFRLGHLVSMPSSHPTT